MDFSSVFRFLIENFNRKKIDFALVGGFALHAAGITRMTQDIDIIIPSESAPLVKKLMLSHGYELLHESQDVSNYVGKKMELGRVDFLHAHRKYAIAMLARAVPVEILGRHKVKVLKAEDLIGLKVQSSSNDPNRYHQDMSDIESLLRSRRGKLDMELIKEYFEVFNRGEELREILKKIDETK